MSYLTAAPEMLRTAAADLGIIRSDLSTAHAAAATRTVALVPAAADEVSAAIAHVFSHHAEDYHVLAEKAAGFHDQFVDRLDAARGAYQIAETANAASLHPGPIVIDHPTINAPSPTPWSPFELLVSQMELNLGPIRLQMVMAIHTLLLALMANIMKAMSDHMAAILHNVR